MYFCLNFTLFMYKLAANQRSYGGPGPLLVPPTPPLSTSFLDVLIGAMPTISDADEFAHCF